MTSIFKISQLSPLGRAPGDSDIIVINDASVGQQITKHTDFLSISNEIVSRVKTQVVNKVIKGSHISISPSTGIGNVVVSVNASSNNIGGAIINRDGNGNFNATGIYCSTAQASRFICPRNALSTAPAIEIGNSDNPEPFGIWGGVGAFTLGVAGNSVVKYEGAEFMIKQGIKDESGGNGLKIKNNGQIVQTGSARSLKQNIQDLDVNSLIDVLTDSRLISFEYISDPGVNTVGMIADELYAIDTRFCYAEDGVPLGINYEMLTLPLIAGYRKQQLEITALSDRITALENA